ncbi:MAG: Do family serine endopeptidase [Bdellovibrionales bacterium]|nr:Do family serine endopeptidase [Bdellovibrionales bacterium]
MFKSKAILVISACFLGFLVGQYFLSSKPTSHMALNETSASHFSSAFADQPPSSHPDQSAVAEKAVKGVVNISSIKIIQYRTFSPFQNDPFFQQFFGRNNPFGQPREHRERSLGSGVLVSKDGHILTNNHVIENASEISVKFSDQTELNAKIIGTDPHTDLALLKVDTSSTLDPIPLGDSDSLRLAETVLAIGSPFGLGGTVTMGIVSAKGRANMGIVDYEDFIQTDAAINPGNSGGALINLKGELVGINTAIFSKSGGYQGIGFAIPSNMASNVMTQLIEKGRVVRGWIGLRYQDLTKEIAKALNQPQLNGAIITHVYPRAPAMIAGLKRGDVVLKFNETEIKSAGHFSKLLSETPVGQSITLTLSRNGQPLTKKVQVQAAPERQRQ